MSKGNLSVVGIIILVIFLIMLLIYVPVDYTSEINYYNTSDYVITKEEFQQYKVSKTLEEVGIRPSIYTYPPIAQIKFHASVDARSKALNERALQIASKYYSKNTLKNIKGDAVDPIFLLALANIEWPSVTDHKVLWSPALPIKFLDEKNWTPEFMDNMNISVFNDAENIWNKVFDTYMGPLQLSIHYGAWVPTIKELKGTEKGNIIASLNGSQPPAWISRNIGLVTQSKLRDTGDRFNWRDACNRTAGQLDDIYGKFLKSSSINKMGIDGNKFATMALLAIGHNTGEGAVYLGDKYTFKQEPSWWIFGPPENARRYSLAVSDKRIVNELNQMADKAVTSYRAGGNFKYNMDKTEAVKLLEKWENAGYIDTSYLNKTKKQYTEKVAYPIQAIYNYFVLYYLYSGR